MSDDPSGLQPIPWKSFFDRHAPYYDQNPFTQNTAVEVQFLLEEIGLKPGQTVLDAGCGTGRHSIGLARAGINVIGVDFAPSMLAEARRKAQDAGANVEWVEADLTDWVRPDTFDAVLCLCEGGFGLANLDVNPVVHDHQLLKNFFAGLVPGGVLVLNALNGLRMLRQLEDAHIASGAFDPVNMLLHHLDELNLPEGKIQMPVRERLYIPAEVSAMVRSAGFALEHLWGGSAGNWGRRPLDLDEIEMMVVARKPK